MEGGGQAGNGDDDIFQDLAPIQQLPVLNHQGNGNGNGNLLQAAVQAQVAQEQVGPHLVPPIHLHMAPNLQGAEVIVGAVQNLLNAVPHVVGWYHANGPVQNQLIPQLGQIQMAELQQFVLDHLLPPAAANQQAAAGQEQEHEHAAAGQEQEHAAAAGQEQEHAAAAAGQRRLRRVPRRFDDYLLY